MVVEVYPSLWVKRFPKEVKDADQKAAYADAAWMRRADLDESPLRFLSPPLEPNERIIAEIEVWI